MDNIVLSFTQHLLATILCQRALLGMKMQNLEAFTKKVTFKLLENEDFQCLTQKLS